MMNSTEQNVLALLIVVGIAGVGALVVAVLSSRTLRNEGFRHLVKRWFG